MFSTIKKSDIPLLLGDPVGLSFSCYKADLFGKICSKNAALDGRDISLPVFLQERMWNCIIFQTTKAITNLESSKAFNIDCLPGVILICLMCPWSNLVFLIFGKSLLQSLYSRMLGDERAMFTNHRSVILLSVNSKIFEEHVNNCWSFPEIWIFLNF